MVQHTHRRIWLYCHNNEETEWATKHCVSDQDCVVGTSCQMEGNKYFPHSGLIPVMNAAIRGKIDFLIVSNLDQLYQDSAQAEELLHTLDSYGVSVKSLRKNGSINS